MRQIDEKIDAAIALLKKSDTSQALKLLSEADELFRPLLKRAYDEIQELREASPIWRINAERKLSEVKDYLYDIYGLHFYNYIHRSLIFYCRLGASLESKRFDEIVFSGAADTFNGALANILEGNTTLKSLLDGKAKKEDILRWLYGIADSTYLNPLKKKILPPVDKRKGHVKLLDMLVFDAGGWQQDAIAETVGLSVNTVSRTLKVKHKIKAILLFKIRTTSDLQQKYIAEMGDISEATVSRILKATKPIYELYEKKRLSMKQMSVLELDVVGLQQDAIADLLGLSEPEVSKTLREGRNILEINDKDDKS